MLKMRVSFATMKVFQQGWAALAGFEAILIVGNRRALLGEAGDITLSDLLRFAPSDVYALNRWRDEAHFAPEDRAAYRRLLAQVWTGG